MNKITYSVIIPHKNIPGLLQRCLDSIPRRDDIQVIVVDDNSDPAMVDFDRFPGSDDSRVELFFTKTGKGAGYARNEGLARARGEWLLFADADDFYNESAFSLFDAYTGSPYDVVYWRVNSVYTDTLLPSGRGRMVNGIIDRYFDTSDEDILRYKSAEPWNKLIRHSLVTVNGLSFDETPAANDVMFSMKVGYAAGKIFADRRTPYCVTDRSTSLIHSVSIVDVHARMEVLVDQSRFLERIGKGHLKPFCGYLLRRSLRCGFGTFLWAFRIAVTNNLSFGGNWRYRSLSFFCRRVKF